MESLEGTPGVSGPVTIKELLETPAWQVDLNSDVFPATPILQFDVWLTESITCDLRPQMRVHALQVEPQDDRLQMSGMEL